MARRPFPWHAFATSRRIVSVSGVLGRYMLVICRYFSLSALLAYRHWWTGSAVLSAGWILSEALQACGEDPFAAAPSPTPPWTVEL